MNTHTVIFPDQVPPEEEERENDMTDLAGATLGEDDAPTAGPRSAAGKPGAGIARIPKITIHAYCETPRTAKVLGAVAADQRMLRVQLAVLEGGVKGAIESYQSAPTPDLIIVESNAATEALVSDLDALAQVCDADTKVVVVGQSNDIALYRDLLRRGISEYLRAPVDPVTVISTVSDVFSRPGAQVLGRVYAFIGARGGVGSSSIAHNFAWMLARNSGTEVVLADMDLAFGSASLNFGVEPAGGIAEALRDAGSLDDQMLERLLTRCDDRLRLLAAPTLLESPDSHDVRAFDIVIEHARASAAHLVLDLPHLWAPWSRKILLDADEVVITATPDLVDLRNAKRLVDMIRKKRPQDSAPRLVLNQVGTPKRPEIKSKEFAKALGLDTFIAVPFDAKSFGAAANKGCMVTEASRRGHIALAIRELAEFLNPTPPRRRPRVFGLPWLFRRA